MEILGKTNQTLRRHIQDCLTVCDKIIARREPFLCQFCQRYGWDWEKVRQTLRFAIWCHDIGNLLTNGKIISEVKVAELHIH